MGKQTEIWFPSDSATIDSGCDAPFKDINTDVHLRENNPESQSHLEENRKHFSDQCKKVLELLQSGVRLTVINAIGYGILSLPRRILDLKENGITVPSVWVTDGNGKRLYKEWYL